MEDDKITVRRKRRVVRLEIELASGEDEDYDPFEAMDDGHALNNEELCNSIYEVISRITRTRVYHVTRREKEQGQQINSEEWSKEFSWTPEVRETLQYVFNHGQFRPQQEEIINSILSGKDTFACLPTGSGKSLLFQLPPLLAQFSKGISLIVVPIIALVADQTRRFNMYQIPCRILNSTQTRLESIMRLIRRTDGKQKPVLFASPEIVMDPNVIAFLVELSRDDLLDRVYLDEAHCVLEWGSTFRSSYLHLKKLRTPSLYVKQIVMLTGSAPPFLRKSLINTMRLDNPSVFVRSHNRENLFIEITPKHSIDKDVQKILVFANERYLGMSGIIYCRTKKSCEMVGEKLKAKGFKKYEIFTGDMSTKQKTDILTRWLSEKTQVVIATVAFGLGIDKPDCRFVVHYDLPSSLETYYQGIGRAGRDGRESHCLMFFDFRDIRKQDLLMKGNSKLFGKYMNFYIFCLESYRCRRYLMLNYFERYNESACGMCDNCILRGVVSNHSKVDVTDHAFRLHEKLIEIGYADVIDEDAGARPKKFRGKKKKSSKKMLTTVRLIDSLLKASKEEHDLAELVDILADIDIKKKEDIAHFLVASMIRDGLLISKFIYSKKTFGYLALFASIEFDAKEVIEKERYVLETGFKYADRSIEKVQGFRPVKILTQTERDFEALEYLRKKLFHERQKSGYSYTGIDEEDRDAEDTPQTIEQFMPVELIRALCDRRPQNAHELIQIRIMPKDLLVYSDQITSIFREGGIKDFERRKQEFRDNSEKVDQMMDDYDELMEDDAPLEEQVENMKKAPKAKKKTAPRNKSKDSNKPEKIIKETGKSNKKKHVPPKKTSSEDRLLQTEQSNTLLSFYNRHTDFDL